VKILGNEKMKKIFGGAGKSEIREGIKLHIMEIHKSNFG
jgi:hypothetical protein